MVGKLKDTESRTGFPGAGKEEKEELFNQYSVLVLQDEKLLDIYFTTMSIHYQVDNVCFHHNKKTFLHKIVDCKQY